MKKIILMITVFLMLVAPALATTDDALIYYSFDDADLTGSNPDDISGPTVRDGTNNGATTGDVNSVLAEAFSYDGTNDYVATSYDPGTTYSFSIWADLQTGNIGDAILGIRDSSGSAGTREFQMGHYTSLGKIDLQYYTSSNGNAGLISCTGYSAGYHHIVMTRSGDNIELYIDGSSCGTDSTSGKINPSYDLTIGRLGDQAIQYFSGELDEFAVYDRVLSSAEVSELYNSGSGYNPYASNVAEFKVIANTYETQQLTDYNITYDGSDYLNYEKVGDPTRVAGINGDAVHFDGNDYIIIDNHTEINDTQAFTVSLWGIKPTTQDGAFYYYETGNDRFSINYHSSGEVRAGFYDGSSFVGSASGSFSTNAWTNIIYVYNGSHGTLYLNNSAQAGTNGISVGSTDGSYIGVRGGSANYLNGSVEDVYIFDRAITSGERSDLFNNPNSHSVNDYIADYFVDYSNTLSTTNGTVVTDVLTNSTGIYNFTVNSSDGAVNYDVNNIVVTTDLIFNYSVLLLYAKDGLTDGYVNNFTINMSGFPYTANNKYTTAYFNEDADNLNTTIDATGYVLKNFLYDTNGTYGLYNRTEYLNGSRSLEVNIYNLSTLIRLNGTNVTLDGSGANTFSNITDDGYILFTNLSVGETNITFTADGYITALYQVTIGNRSFQTLDAYLTTPQDTSVTFTVRPLNDDTAVIEGATIQIWRKINTTYTLVDTDDTDVTGRILYYYEPDVDYRFIITAEDYLSKTFELDPIVFSSYTVFLDSNVSIPDYDLYNGAIVLRDFTPFVKNSLVNYSVTISDGDGTLALYGLNITDENGTVVLSHLTGTNAYGQTWNGQLNVSNYSVGDRFYLDVFGVNSDGDRFNATFPYTMGSDEAGLIYNARGETYGMSLFERVFIITIITLLLAGTFFLFTGYIGAGVVGLFTLGYFTFIQLVSPWILIPVMIAIFLLIVWRASE